MSIATYLIEQRRKLIRSHKLGFDSNPALIPGPVLVSRLSELRHNEFLTFRRNLRIDGVIIFKVLTAVDSPALQEGLLIGNLRGEAQLVNLTEISGMSSEERRNEESLTDLKSLFDDPKTFKIVEGAADLIKLGERIHHRLDPTAFLALDTWYPELRRGFLPTVKSEFPGRYDALTVAFRGDKHPGWRWDFNQDPEVLSGEQTQLGYALISSLISLSLGGIVHRTYGREWEKNDVAKLAETMAEITDEEVLLFHEARQLQAVEIGADGTEAQNEEAKENKNLRFKIFEGVEVAESLPGGFQ